MLSLRHLFPELIDPTFLHILGVPIPLPCQELIFSRVPITLEPVLIYTVNKFGGLKEEFENMVQFLIDIR